MLITENTNENTSFQHKIKLHRKNRVTCKLYELPIFIGILTGNSSLELHTPEHCLCDITCLMFNNGGSATQPA